VLLRHAIQQNLVEVPHVPEMTCLKAFLGILDRVREYSIAFETHTLGMNLVPAAVAARPGLSNNSEQVNVDTTKKKKIYITKGSLLLHLLHLISHPSISFIPPIGPEQPQDIHRPRSRLQYSECRRVPGGGHRRRH
jgi:hypothetical protein